MRAARYHIRRAVLADAEAVETLWVSLMMQAAGIDARFQPAEDARARWRADFPEWIHDPSQALLVAEHSDAIAGFVSARLWGPPPVFKPAVEVFVEYLYVDTPYRREGIGSALVAETTRWGAARQANCLRLGRLATDETAGAFWQRCGAEPFVVEMTVPIRVRDA